MKFHRWQDCRKYGGKPPGNRVCSTCKGKHAGPCQMTDRPQYRKGATSGKRRA
jgi:hypothetical protein